MVDQPPPPPHVRHAEMEQRFEDALKSHACRKRLKQAAEKVASDTKRIDKKEGAQ